MLPPLRPYQADVLERASEASASSNGILIVQPTGTGKTRVAVEAVARHHAMGGLALFIAPRRELVNQARAALALRGLVDGHDCFVRTVQQLMALGAGIPGVTLVIVDEARHYVADEWRRLRKLFPDALFLGLDATPERGDGRGLGTAHGGLFDVLLEAINIRDAVAGGFLVPCDTIRPKEALGPGELAQDPVDAYFEHAPGTSAVLFAGSVELATRYAQDFNKRGVRAAPVWGDMQVSARDFWLSEYARGACKVLCNVALLTEGWDAPITETVILAGPCGTVGGLLQRAGRGMRLFDGKRQMKLLDLRGVTHTFGNVDEDRTWYLEGKAARRAADDIEIRFCPVCGAPTPTAACETCGYSGALRKRKPRVLGLPMDRFARQHAMSDERAAKELRGLYMVAERKRYKRFWAERIFSHKYGRPVTPELRRLAARG